MSTPRLRMFAGPNGSGKSTLNSIVSRELLGIYVNADEIEKEIKKSNLLDLSSYTIISDEKSVVSFFMHHPLLIKAGFNDVCYVNFLITPSQTIFIFTFVIKTLYSFL